MSDTRAPLPALVRLMKFFSRRFEDLQGGAGGLPALAMRVALPRPICWRSVRPSELLASAVTKRLSKGSGWLPAAQSRSRRAGPWRRLPRSTVLLQGIEKVLTGRWHCHSGRTGWSGRCSVASPGCRGMLSARFSRRC